MFRSCQYKFLLCVVVLLLVVGILKKQGPSYFNQTIMYKQTIAEQAFDAQREPKIPHIIHQAWDSYNVPKELSTWIKTWMQYNPTWVYYLWTPDDVRALLKSKYPEYLQLYNAYRFNIFRSDAMRYFLMDTFGGFYVDLDVECLKGLDQWTFDHNCVLSHETYEHPYLLFGKTSPNVMTTIFACRPGHPYFKMVIKALPESFKKYPTDVLNGTGPFFLDRVFRLYNKTGLAHMIGESPQENSGADDITVLPPKYFLPARDPHNAESIKKKCLNNQETLSKPALDICDVLKKKNFTNIPTTDSYTNHHWVHMFLSESIWSKKETDSIFKLVPGAQTYRKLQSKHAE